ncbi:hypothetical protein JXB41_04555 [Candidatus Woesearchaeota archaeon]|nr:hypothetical protein [Candidatus Woesearchaeota archaeon]
MELEQFIENSIIRFLDTKIENRPERGKKIREEETGLFDFQKDYVKELNNALEKYNLAKARELFRELKERYKSLPKTDINREKIYSILAEMSTAVKEYVSRKDTIVNPMMLGKDFELPEKKGEKKEIKKQVKKPEIKLQNSKNYVIREQGSRELQPKDEEIGNQVFRKQEKPKIKNPVDDVLKKLSEQENRLREKALGTKKEKSMIIEEDMKKPLPQNYAGRQKKELMNERLKRNLLSESLKEEEEARSREKKREEIEKGFGEIKRYILKGYYKLAEEHYKRLKEKALKFNAAYTHRLLKLYSSLQKAKYSLNEKGDLETEIDKMYRKGIYHFFNTEYDTAIEIFTKILKIRPNHMAAKIRLNEAESIKSLRI